MVTSRSSARPWRTVAHGAIAMTIGLLLITAGSVMAAPGNNGTVKIDGVAFDTHPNNEPHVGCVFEVDWYGFEANVVSHVRFKIWPPSGGMVTLLEDDVQLDNDGPAGGGSRAGLDGEKEYDLGDEVSAYFEHPKQGFHVKLTINTPGSKGSDVKHKVFWVKGCKPTPTPTPTPTRRRRPRRRPRRRQQPRRGPRPKRRRRPQPPLRGSRIQAAHGRLGSHRPLARVR